MKNFNIKGQILNHITKNGKKRTSEKILTRNFKELQKNSIKQTKEILRTAIVRSTPIFKFNEFQNKNKRKKIRTKKVPIFLSQKSTRFSQAIKILIKTSKTSNLGKYYLKMANEILGSISKNGNAPETKSHLQKEVLTNRRYLKNYRWKIKKKLKKPKINIQNHKTFYTFSGN